MIASGRVNEAARHFQKIIEINPVFLNSQNPDLENNAAWALATNPEPAKRNGKIAVILAEAACRQTHFKTTIMVGTLAAAYAEVERFDDAISTEQKACALAAEVGENNLLKKNRELLAIYLKHMPYREEPDTSTQTGGLK